MGCCASTIKPPPSSQFHKHSSRSSRAPPPPPLPPVDVETVKEVFYETPNQNPFVKIENNPNKIESTQKPYKFQQEDQNLENPNISDIEIFRRKMIDRSPAKTRNRNQVPGEFQFVPKSPVRGKEQSPGRVGSDQGRNSRGTGFGSPGRKRLGSGDVSAARSRSPAKRTVAGGGFGGKNEIGQSMSGRRTGKSPGRVGSDLHERVRKPELHSGRVREESWWSPTVANDDESLENPLVSLECFIFL